MSQEQGSGYGLSQPQRVGKLTLPTIDYHPPRPRAYSPAIALIGAGGISEYHLRAYQRMGLRVSAICDLDIERARRRQRDYYPEAIVTDNFSEAIAHRGIEVVDVATHPQERLPILEEAIRAGKHVLSQKPFVLDLDAGERLVELAARHQVKLAVNQNGRYAPHFRFLTRALAEGHLGELASLDFVLHWDHTWTESTPFNNIHHLLLLDFAIHWFDMINVLSQGREAKQVYASVRRTAFQTAKPPFLAQVMIDFDTIQARLACNAHVIHGQEDRTIVAGSRGTLRAFGPSLNDQAMHWATDAGEASLPLAGCWFDSGFEGTMGELLCAIEQQREPENSARANLPGLALCFAAVASADLQQPTTPGEYRSASLTQPTTPR